MADSPQILVGMYPASPVSTKSKNGLTLVNSAKWFARDLVSGSASPFAAARLERVLRHAKTLITMWYSRCATPGSITAISSLTTARRRFAVSAPPSSLRRYSSAWNCQHCQHVSAGYGYCAYLVAHAINENEHQCTCTLVVTHTLRDRVCSLGLVCVSENALGCVVVLLQKYAVVRCHGLVAGQYVWY
jgi:hypothetical protein